MATEPHANPSRDPANDGLLVGTLRQVLDKFLQGVDDMLPARVISYNRAKNRATVLPLVKLLTTDGRAVTRAQVAAVPVMQFGGGGMALSFNLKKGDLGWIKANDRDISLILQAYAEGAPNTLRKHSFQDAAFIPDIMRGLTLAGEDAENAVLQTLDGAVKIALWPDRIKLAVGALSLTIGPTQFEFVGHANFPDGVSVGGIEFGSHKHTGVDPGSGTSGGPTS